MITLDTDAEIHVWAQAISGLLAYYGKGYKILGETADEVVKEFRERKPMYVMKDPLCQNKD